MGQMLKNLGEKVTIISAYGKDLPFKTSPQINLIPHIPTSLKSLVFKNIYEGKARTQIVGNLISASLPRITKTDIKSIETADVVVIAPILNNLYESEVGKIIELFSDKPKVLLPQGFFRGVSGKSNIIFNGWIPTSFFLNKVDLVIFSDKDTSNADKLAGNWSTYKPIVIVTKESLGCTIYQNGKSTDISAFNIKNIIDSTGAGDVFAAACGYAYFRSKDIEKAALFANAAAGLSLRFMPNDLQYNLKDIQDLIRSQTLKVLNL